MNIELFSIEMNFLLILEHKIDKETTEVVNCLGTHWPIKSMIKKDDVMPNWIIFGSNEKITRVSITVYKSMLKHHGCKDVDQIFSN